MESFVQSFSDLNCTWIPPYGTHSMEQNRTEHFNIFKFNAPFILHLTKTCVHSSRQCPPPCVCSPFLLPQLFLVRFLCSEAAPISGFVNASMCQKNVLATSRQGRRLRFGMLTVLTNISQDVMVEWSPFLGWSPSNYNLLYCTWIWLPIIIKNCQGGHWGG